jgi:hypothetical protein
VRGAFARILPGYDDDGAVASVYADIAWRHGWLRVDRVLPDGDHRRRATTPPVGAPVTVTSMRSCQNSARRPCGAAVGALGVPRL